MNFMVKGMGVSLLFWGRAPTFPEYSGLGLGSFAPSALRRLSRAASNSRTFSGMLSAKFLVSPKSLSKSYNS